MTRELSQSAHRQQQVQCDSSSVCQSERENSALLQGSALQTTLYNDCYLGVRLLKVAEDYAGEEDKT